jgi:hypothetical protein
VTPTGYKSEVSEGTSSAQLPVPRWTALLLGVAALGLVPWTLYLTYTLPARHVTHDWNVAWAGFDVAIASALVATAVGVLVCGPWLEATAAVAATLLVADAWFDVILADGGGERREAILLAVVAELPLALFCLWIALNVERALRAFGARR